VRGFVAGFILIPAVVISLLSFRPGGLRRQLRLAGRRFRIALTVAGAYIVGAAIVRLAFPTGAISDYGPPVLALVLAVVYIVLAQDPTPEAES
jgi:hypothetical protein